MCCIWYSSTLAHWIVQWQLSPRSSLCKLNWSRGSTPWRERCSSPPSACARNMHADHPNVQKPNPCPINPFQFRESTKTKPELHRGWAVVAFRLFHPRFYSTRMREGGLISLKKPWQYVHIALCNLSKHAAKNSWMIIKSSVACITPTEPWV